MDDIRQFSYSYTAMWRTGRGAVSGSRGGVAPVRSGVCRKGLGLAEEHGSLTHSPAVEECSQKGCLALSLLELLGFNLTFVFLGSLLVLIEVRGLFIVQTWGPMRLISIAVTGR